MWSVETPACGLECVHDDREPPRRVDRCDAVLVAGQQDRRAPPTNALDLDVLDPTIGAVHSRS